MLYGLLVLVIVGTIVWMAADAYYAGRSWGSIISWVLGALLVWLLVFPWYLAARRHFDEATDPGDDDRAPPIP
jgi:4-amino-4-deoxy-L-arabinose transferase-like glycosyltransferase